MLGGHRTNNDGAAVGVDAAQFAQILEIHQMARLGQAQLHHRDRAVPAGDDADIVTVAREDGEGLVEGPWTMILERRGYHNRAPPIVCCANPEERPTIQPEYAAYPDQRAPRRIWQDAKDMESEDLQEIRNRRTNGAPLAVNANLHLRGG